jgi:hypothetical protein
MTKLQRDFLGPFLECNGTINRPSDISQIAGAGVLSLTIKHIIYTPTFKVLNGLGAEETWYACGGTSAYKEARDTLPKVDFEHFCLFACGPELMRFSVTPYSGLRALFPKGYVDYLDPAFQAHMALEKALSSAFSGRRNAAYAAKYGLPTPASAYALKTTMPAAAGLPLSIVRPTILSAQRAPSPAVAPPAGAATNPFRAPVRRRKP